MITICYKNQQYVREFKLLKIIKQYKNIILFKHSYNHFFNFKQELIFMVNAIDTFLRVTGYQSLFFFYTLHNFYFYISMYIQ